MAECIMDSVINVDIFTFTFFVCVHLSKKKWHHLFILSLPLCKTQGFPKWDLYPLFPIPSSLSWKNKEKQKSALVNTTETWELVVESWVVQRILCSIYIQLGGFFFFFCYQPIFKVGNWCNGQIGDKIYNLVFVLDFSSFLGCNNAIQG